MCVSTTQTPLFTENPRGDGNKESDRNTEHACQAAALVSVCCLLCRIREPREAGPYSSIHMTQHHSLTGMRVGPCTGLNRLWLFACVLSHLYIDFWREGWVGWRQESASRGFVAGRVGSMKSYHPNRPFTCACSSMPYCCHHRRRHHCRRLGDRPVLCSSWFTAWRSSR